MNQIKGLSQILYLIIAASVLMIAALSIVFMLDEGLSGIADFGGEADNTACQNALDTRCAPLGDDAVIDVPSTCEDSEGNQIPPANTLADNNDEISCSDVT